MPNDHDEEPDRQEPSVPPPPRGAPLHLQMVLQTVRDPAQRQQLLDTYEEMGPGLQQELFGQVGAYLSAILDHGTVRDAEHADDLARLASDLASIAESMHQILAAYSNALAAHKAPENASTQKPDEARANVVPNPRTLDAVQRIVAAEVDRAVAAARAVQARNLKIACGACFFAGAFFCALLVLFIHMALAR